jgi:hypothetical protein
MYKSLLISITFLTLALTVSGQETLRYKSADELQRDVTFLLLDKNINEVIRQLDTVKPSTADALLQRLIIYSRAGQLSQVRKTLEQLPATPNWQCPTGYDLRWLLKSADTSSLAARRFYYERLCPSDADGADEFIALWSSTGDLKELDAWLEQRWNQSDEWMTRRVQLRAKSGTANELLDQLAAEVKANPADWLRLERYLRANNYGGNVQDVTWVADTFEVRTAADYFILAERLRTHSPQAGVKLLRKSLELPFTEVDAKQVSDLISRTRSIGLSIKINWEKQLRYWTKRSLAETYQSMNQSLMAQPLVEELVAVKGDDILLQDAHQLAGMVQSGSGHRVVETKILGDETARRSTAGYWLERANYYAGRDEYERERDSYREALVALNVKPEDSKGLNERYEVVRSFSFFLADEHNDKENKPELEKLLAQELSRVPPETYYAFQIARLITNNEFELSALKYSLLAKQPLFLARLLDGRREWGNEERFFIEAVMDQEEVSAELRDRIWSSLVPIVRDPGSTRAFHLAEAMKSDEQWQRAIPLLRGYVEHASAANWEGYKTEAMNDLVTAYCRAKEWRAAEKFLLAQTNTLWRSLPGALAEVAVVAAQQNAIEDAMRLWRMSTNLDRRNLETLPQLAQTKARTELLAMYTTMKKEDPLSTIPDLALRLLQ